MRLQTLGKEIPFNVMKMLMTLFAHVRITLFSDVSKLTFIAQGFFFYFYFFLIRPLKKFMTFWKNIDSKNATGYDNVPPEILKMAADEWVSSLTNLINISVERSCFLSDMKKPELSQLYKCKHSLVPVNFHSFSILPSVIKIYIISNYANILNIFCRTFYLLPGRNHQPHDCLLNRSFRRRSKKTSTLRVTGLCEGKSPVTGEFLAQRTNNAENVSIWRRHHDSIHFISITHLEHFNDDIHDWYVKGFP